MKKMISVEIILGMGEGGIKYNDEKIVLKAYPDQKYYLEI